MIAGGVIFGPLAGTLLSLLAATLASSASFLFARWLGRELLLKYVGQTAIFQAIEKASPVAAPIFNSDPAHPAVSL